MKAVKNSLCALAAIGMVGMGLLSLPAQAEESRMAPHVYPYYHGYSVKKGMPLTRADEVALTKYFEYEEREPCQNYQEVPPGFFRVGCTLSYAVPVAAPAPAPMPAPPAEVARKVQTSYQIHFAFDRSDIESQAMQVLDGIARDISKFQPYEVTVAGHADTSGPADYNYALSQRRANAVSRELTQRGVPNRVIETRALGETDPAVQTGDGVKERQNRRVVVEFIK